MQKIILYLHTDHLTHVSWGIINEAGTLIQTVTRGQIHDFVAHAKDKELTVILPAQDVLLTSTKIPKMSRQRLQQALPYALEEQLLGDVADLHFATGSYLADGNLPVAIVSLPKMQEWISFFKEMNLTPSVFVTASLLPPLNEKNWAVVIDGDLAIIHTDSHNGFACDTNNLQLIMEAKLAEQLSQPDTITVSHYTPHPIALTFKDIHIVEKQFPETQLIEDFSRWVASPSINLLQGAFLTKRKASYSKKIWLFAGYFAIAWVALIFINLIGSFFILHHQVSALDNGINHIYKKHFPEATSIIAPKQRMEEKLNELSSQGHRNPLLLWLAYIGKALAEATGVHIDQLEYRNNQLMLKLTSPSINKIDSFTHSLSEHGLVVKQQNAVLSNDSAKCNLLITEGTKQ